MGSSSNLPISNDDFDSLPPELQALLRNGNPYVSDNSSPNVATPPFLPTGNPAKDAGLRAAAARAASTATPDAPVFTGHPARVAALRTAAQPTPAAQPAQDDTDVTTPGLSLRDRILGGVRAAIAGASQPNIAFGGPKDTLRAIAATNQAQEGQTMQQRALARQKVSDELARQKTQADIARSNAEAAMYGAHTKAYDALGQQREDIHKDDREIDPTFARANLPWVVPDAAGKYYVPKTVFNTLAKPTRPPNPNRPGEVQVEPDFAKGNFPGVLPDENGNYWVPSSVYAQTQKPDPKDAPPLVHGTQIDENGNGTAFWVTPDGQPHTVSLGQVGKPMRPAADPNAVKPATPNQFRMVEKTKRDRLSAIDKETDARIKKEATDELGNYDDAAAQKIYAEASEKKNQVQLAYLSEIQALKPDFDPSQATQTIATAPPALPAARAAAARAAAAQVAAPAPTQAPPPAAAPIPAGPTQIPGPTSRSAKPPAITFQKEKLPEYVKQNNAARQAKGLQTLTIDQTKRALEGQGYEIQ